MKKKSKAPKVVWVLMLGDCNCVDCLRTFTSRKAALVERKGRFLDGYGYDEMELVKYVKAEK